MTSTFCFERFALRNLRCTLSYNYNAVRSREETSALTNTSEESLIRKEEKESWCEYLNIWWKYEKTRGWTMNISWHCVLRCSFLQQQKSFVSPRRLIQRKFPLSSPLFHSRPLSSSTPLIPSQTLSFPLPSWLTSPLFPSLLSPLASLLLSINTTNKIHICFTLLEYSIIYLSELIKS